MAKHIFSEQTDELINLLSHGLSVEANEDLFPTMTRHLAQLLDADYALIGELVPGEQEQIKPLACTSSRERSDNLSYLLAGTPCEQILKHSAGVFEQDIQKIFPKDKLLIELNAESYAGTPLRDVSGEVLGIVCIISSQPITKPKQTEQLLRIFAGRAGSELERKRDHEALHLQEQRFRRFYERSPLSYQSLDAEGRYIDINPAWIDTFGYSREEILGRKFSDILTDDSQALVTERFPRLKDTGEIREATFDIRHKDGHILKGTLNGRASYDERGEFLHTNCILIDVTHASKADELLRQSEEENRMMSRQLQTVLDGIQDRILLLDRDLRIVWTNQEKDWQQNPFPSNPKGNLCHEAMHGNAVACPECPAVDSFTSGTVVSREQTSTAGDIWLKRAFPVFDDQGEVANVVEIAQDITEKITLQKETVRTGQLASLGELAAGVAHEINNPITGVINCAQLIINRSTGECQERELAERIIKEGERVARIVSQLLFHAKEENADLKPLDLTDVLSDSLAMVGSQFNKENINVVITLAENLPKMAGHVQQLQQVFLNILSNARYALNKRYPEATPDKRLEVTLECKKSDTRSALIARFHDHGIGIPATLLHKVLQPFITSKPSTEGTGLGLSISNDIINNHGATMSIESEEGVYTEVTIQFPVLQAEKNP